MSKVKYYSEEELIEKVQSGEYGWLDYISHHSPELVDEYVEYLEQRGKDLSDATAEQFLNMKQRMFDEAVAKGEL